MSGLMKVVRHRLHVLPVLVSAGLLAGCTSLPDTGGYTTASYSLKYTSTAAGLAVLREFENLAIALPQERQERVQSAGKDFGAAWGSTVRSMDGLARYAESVEELTAAGNKGADSARQLAGSLQALGTAVGFVPGGEAVTLVGDTLAMANSAIANVRATKSLTRSLAASDPIIADYSGIIARQIETARRQFDRTIQLQSGAVGFEVQEIMPVYTALKLRESQVAERLATLTNDGGEEAARVAAAAELERIRTGLSGIEPRIADYHAAMEALAMRQKVGQDLFDATATALLEWRQSHQKVVRAVEEKRPVSFASLEAASADIRELLRRWREL